MKKEFTHYGQKVLLAGNRSRYEMILEKNNVEYTPLPILSKTYRVVKYNNKYAVILTKKAEDDLESVIAPIAFILLMNSALAILASGDREYLVIPPCPASPNCEKVLILSDILSKLHLYITFVLLCFGENLIM